MLLLSLQNLQLGGQYRDLSRKRGLQRNHQKFQKILEGGSDGLQGSI